MYNRFFNSFSRLSSFLVLLFHLFSWHVCAQWEEVNLPKGGEILGIETDGDAVLAMMPSGVYRWKPGIPWKKCHEQVLESHAYFKHTKGIFYLNDADLLSGKPIIYSMDQGDTWSEIKNFKYDKWSARANGQKLFARNLQRDSFFVTSDFGENWTYLPDATPGTGKILDFAVLEDTMVIILPDQIMRSFDGGDTWESLPPPQSFPPAGITNCYLVTAQGLWYAKYYQNGSLLYRSHDDGASWESLGPAQPYDKIWRIGDRVYAYFSSYSDDDGLTWTSFYAPGINHDFLEYQGKLLMSNSTGLFEDTGDFLWHSLNSNFPVKINTAANDEFLIVPAGDNILLSSGYYSPDGGENWYLPQTTRGMNGTPAEKGDTIVCTTLNSGILYTIDGGRNWSVLPLGNIVSPFSVLYANDTLYLLAGGNKLWRTIDLGQNWHPASLPANIEAYKLAFDGNSLYVMDQVNKKVWQSPDHGQTWKDLNNGFPSNTFVFTLYANTNGAFVAANDHLYRYDEQTEQWGTSDDGFWSYEGPWSVETMSSSGNLVATVRETTNPRGFQVSPDGGHHWFDALIAGIDLYAAATAANFHDGWLYATTVNLDDNTRRFVRRPMSGITTVPVTGRIYDQIQPGVPNVVVRLRSGNGFATPAPNTAYELHGLTGPDTLELAPIPGYSNVVPAFWVVSEGGPNYDFYLGLPDPVCDIAITNFTPFKADAETAIAVDLGCTPDTGQAVNVKIFLPANLNYVSAQPNPSSINTNVLEWIGLQQNNNGFPEINLTVRTSAQAMIGDPILIWGSFTKGNMTYTDTLQASVVSSFDPNDKQCLPILLSLQEGQSGAVIDYTIRFQNTGTATAETVRIRDTLNQNIDIGSVQLVAASHPNTMNLLPGRVLEFLFTDIMLPDSNANEPASHGFVRFSARNKTGLEQGDSIPNRVAIYFDLNAPVITNSCVTTVDEIIGTKESDPAKQQYQIRISPNPASGTVRLSVPGQTLRGASISATDATGKFIRTWHHPDSDFFEIPAGDLSPGAWFVTVRQNEWVATKLLFITD